MPPISAAVRLYTWDENIAKDNQICRALEDLGYHPNAIPANTEGETTPDEGIAAAEEADPPDRGEGNGRQVPGEELPRAEDVTVGEG